ncbi:MAG: hypothetical protein FWD18_06530 [Micrococcales bacterium]|nr:hypothetical protein [Micrococcales bacterium]
MRNHSQTRDRYRLGVTGTTIAAAGAAIVATGWLAGCAAAEQNDDEAGTTPETTLTPRPVETRVVEQTSDEATDPALGGGGTVAVDPPADLPADPAPAAPPAPSTGS